MKKAALFLVLCLATGWLAQEVQAQKDSPKQRIRVITKDSNGNKVAYEYNSREEMQQDERLKGLNLPLPLDGNITFEIDRDNTYDRLLENAGSLRQLNDSVKIRRFSFHPDSNMLKQVDRARFVIVRGMENVPLEDLLKQRDSAMAGGMQKELRVLKLRGVPAMEEMPADMQQMLKERGLDFKEGDVMICLSHHDSVPHPPVPPVPPMPAEAAGLAVPPVPPLPAEAADFTLPPVPAVPPVPAPEAVAERSATPAEAPSWLEELAVYPTPSADGQVQLRFKSKNRGEVLLRLIDLNGKVVYEERVPDAANTIERTIQAPNGERGIMVLQIQQGGNTYSRRVILE
ncbi:T9SS type A sorting domain-containing protein [Cesiribacter sp. SM1]|uniref:T9SS type A sorting domain-containing protein n=1 Tax=Cesiribacter sp. SM1 TaxID=2861196 RepID=UPI001CD631AA|nr:T9SS type A sorting domain-containing protein [Cesiribacter sp. SM1]